MKQGQIFIISGPSGVGKNTIIEAIFAKHPELTSIPTYTTRPQRPDDKKFKARISIAEAEFKKMASAGEFIDWQKIHQWNYGKKNADAEKILQAGKNLLLEIDVHGLPIYKRQFPNIQSIFIQYENLDQFKNRLQISRPGDTEHDIAIRYQTALEEMEHVFEYDHVITNIEGKPEIAIDNIDKIISQTLAK